MSDTKPTDPTQHHPPARAAGSHKETEETVDLIDSLELPEGATAERLSPDLSLLSIPVPEPRLPPLLTATEEEIALLVYAGAGNAEIAQARGTSIKTVGNQLDQLYRKLGVSSRVELALLLRGGR